MASPKIDTPFVAIPEWLLRWQPPAKANVRLSLTDKLVWAAFRDRIGLEGRSLSLRRMAAFLGTTCKLIGRSTDKLERAGLLPIERNADPLTGERTGRANRYQVNRPNVDDPTTLGKPERGQDGYFNADDLARQRGRNGYVDRDDSTSHTEQTASRQQTPVVAASDVGEIKALLVEQGIEAKVAAAEAARPGIAVELVRAAVAWADEQKGLRNRAGFILTAIRDKSPELLEHVKVEQRRAEDERRRKADIERLERDRQTVAAIPDAEWSAVTAEACQRIRDRWPLARPEPEIERAGRSVEHLSPLLISVIAQVHTGRDTPIASRRGVA